MSQFYRFSSSCSLLTAVLMLSACSETVASIESETTESEKLTTTPVIISSAAKRPQHNLELDSIKLPEGFEIDVYNVNVPNARQMALSDSGTLFIGTRKEGVVYALQDKDGDGYAETKHIIAKDLRMPSGLVFHAGDLYVGAVSKIIKFVDIDESLDNPPEPILISDQFPDAMSCEEECSDRE